MNHDYCICASGQVSLAYRKGHNGAGVDVRSRGVVITYVGHLLMLTLKLKYVLYFSKLQNCQGK